MNYTLNNNSIGISVKKYGAELSSFKSLDTSIEYLLAGQSRRLVRSVPYSLPDCRYIA